VICWREELQQVHQVPSGSRLWPWASSIASLRPDEAGVSILFGQTTPKAGESGIEFPAHIGYKSSS